MTLGLYSQHLIFFLPYEWPQYASVTSQWARRLARDKYAVLFIGPFITYEEN
jgi:hypothetical protein